MKTTHDFNWLAKRARTGLALLLGCFALVLSGPLAQAELSDGLVGYWPLDGDLEDKSESDPPAHGVGKIWEGNHQNMPENLADLDTADATYVTGKFGQSGKFADAFYVETPLELEDRFDFGAIDDLDEDDPEEEDPDLKGFTISLWVTVDQFTKGWQCPVGKGEQNQWRVHRRGDGRTFTGNGGNGDTPDGVIEAPEDEDGDGTWYHILLRSDRENDKHDFWVNGTEDATGDGITPTGNVMPMMIGQNPDTADRTWEGNIDDVAMWNRPLTDDEIAQIWNGGDGTSVETALDPSDPNVSGSKSLTLKDVLPETEQAFALNISNTGDTKPLNISNVTLAGADIDHFTIVDSPTAIAPDSKAAINMTFNGFQQLGTFNATVSYTTDDPDADDKEIVVAITALIPNPDGPLAHYPLDDAAGSTDATDTTTNQYLGVYDENSGSLALGGAALSGEGSSMTVNGGGLLRFDAGFPLDQYSVSFFFQANELGGLPADLRTLVGQGEGTPEAALLLAGGDLHWFGEETILFSTSGAPIEIGETYHVAMIYDGTVGSIVLDGVVVASNDVSVPASDGTFYAGAFGSDGALGLDGILDDIQFYGRVLDLEVEVPFLIDNAGRVLDPFATGQDPDSDGDGISDKLEVSQYMTDPQDKDTDGDGLEDGDEVTRGTNPLSGDTDGDGFGDSAEVAGNYDPTSADSPSLPDIINSIGDAVVQYDFNEGSGTDIGNGGTGGNGTLTNAHGGAWVASGGVGDSGYLNFVEEAAAGADAQYVATGLDAGGVNIAEGPYTMVTWVRAANTIGDNMIFGQVEDQNVLHNGIRNANFHIGHWGNDITGGDVVVGEWQHVAYRFDEGVQTIFVDGVQVQTAADKGGVAVDAEITIGSTRAGDTRFFSGDLDEVRIYNEALTDIQITGLFASSGDGDGDDLGQGLIAYFPFDGDLEDKAGDSHGTGVGDAIEFADGQFGQGIDLNGANHVITPVENEELFDFPEGNFSVSAWFRVDSFDKNWQALVTKGEGSNWRIHRRGDTDHLGPVAGPQADNATAGADMVDGPDVNDGAIHHVIITNGPDGAAYYLDGVLAGEAPAGGTQGNEWPMMIGENADGGGNGRTWNGLIDDVAVWNRGLSADEVGLLFNGASLGQQIGGGGGVAGLEGYWPAEYVSTAADHLDLGTIPAQTLDSDFTWSFWVNAEETNNNNVVFGNRYNADGVDFAPREFLKFTPKTFEWHFNGGGENIDAGEATWLPVGVWSHNLVVKAGSTLTYYRDGAEIATGEITGAPVNAQPLYLGGQPGADGSTVEGFSGAFKEVATFDQALSPADVTDVYNRGLNGESLDGMEGGGDRPSGISDVVLAGDGGSVSFSFPAGTTFDVEYSTDLVDWLVIAPDVSGDYTDSDAGRAGAASGYYRGVAK
ncbi:hypothetical protein N9260_00830 [bacterium]|nr:hypothetical protein [bacterium]